MSYIDRIFSYLSGKTKPGNTPNKPVDPTLTSRGKKDIPLPAGRVSENPKASTTSIQGWAKEQSEIITPDFTFEIIPHIRNLAKINEDMGQALNNIVTLGNTGHRIKFDPTVSPEQVDKMRYHLREKGRIWGKFYGGMDGLINRMFSQAMIGGAISNEWVPSKDLKDGIRKIVFVNPEDIRFTYDKRLDIWVPHQLRKSTLPVKNSTLIPLNIHTYQYHPLNGDTEVPYGTPPYLNALDGLKDQKFMKENISHIIEQVGVLGFLQILLDKPDKLPNENDAAYISRLEGLLDKAKSRTKDGFRDGINVGFKDDVEYEFHTATSQVTGVKELFQENELQIMSGLKQDAVLMGRGYSTSETQITVVFSKMLAELANVQNLVRQNLTYGYVMELRLAGFNFKYLDVEFKSSTLQDELKFQQGLEIKIRNVIAKYNQGIINNDQAADELGYEKPDQKEARIPLDLAGDAKKKQDREASKDKSDRKVRSKNKPQGSKK